MKTFMEKLRIVFTDKSLRTRIFLTLGILALSRLLASIPIPGIDVSELQNFLSNQFIGLLNIFSGGGLSNLSVVMLGVGPYITASIIMQLLTMMSPKLKAMYQEEGQAGRLKFTQISRILTVPLALVQAFSFLAILQRQGVISPLVGFDLVSNLIVIIDLNGQQAFGYTDQVLNLHPMIERWKAFGWDAQEADGHNVKELTAKIAALNTTSGPPHVIIANTVSGKGVSFMEHQIKWHYWPMSDEEYRQAMDDIEVER